MSDSPLPKVIGLFPLLLVYILEIFLPFASKIARALKFSKLFIHNKLKKRVLSSTLQRHWMFLKHPMSGYVR
jgi:hypothetical protein